VLSDEAWARVEPFMLVVSDKGGRPFADHRTMVEAIVYRYRTGIPWRDHMVGAIRCHPPDTPAVAKQRA